MNLWLGKSVPQKKTLFEEADLLRVMDERTGRTALDLRQMITTKRTGAQMSALLQKLRDRGLVATAGSRPVDSQPRALWVRTRGGTAALEKLGK